MRRNLLFFIAPGIAIAGAIIVSCSKENNLLQNGNMYINNQINAPVPNTGTLTDLELLGRNIYYDKISVPGNMACADCHSAKVGYTGPIPGINLHGSVYRGAVPTRFGNRKPPSAAYAGDSPILYYDGIWHGGMFWDGRATGWTLGDPLAEQALGPFLNPVEQNNPDVITILKKIATSKYSWLWEKVYGEKLSLDPALSVENYIKVGRAIAAFERSPEVSAFSSKFDGYLNGKVSLTALELKGMELFNGKAKCSACHISSGSSPLFTDFSYDNLGVPKNPANPYYNVDPDFIDWGLGGFLESIGDATSTDQMGKHKVPTLRNVDKRPGAGFPKDYMHNGVFKSLKEVVHFYNTRDDGSWPAPEVDVNINTTELGNLGLTGAEEDAIVAFMKTLSDGYVKR